MNSFPQDELQAEKQTAVDDGNIKRMRIEHRYSKPRLPMPTDDDRITMLAEQANAFTFIHSDFKTCRIPCPSFSHFGFSLIECLITSQNG